MPLCDTAGSSRQERNAIRANHIHVGSPHPRRLRKVNEIRSRRPVTLAALGLIVALAVSGTPGVGSAAGEEGSGGRAVAHRQGGSRIASKALAARAPVARRHPVGLPAGEPTIGVTSDEQVFFVALPGRSEVLRSKDGGKTWKVVSPKLPNGSNAHRITFDPYIYVDERTDRVFTIDLTVACSYMSYSDDRGKTWLTNPLACGRPVNDHQSLFSGPPVFSPTVGYPNVVYYCWNDVATSSCSKSLDGGITFSPTGSPAFLGIDPTSEEDDKVCGGLHGHGHVGRDGTVYLPRGYCGQPFLAISRDEGATWTRVQVSNKGILHHEAGVATDRKGNIYYAWVARDRLPYLAISRDGGETWDKPMMIGAPGVNESNLPGIAVGGPGKVAVIYMGTTNSPGKPFPEQSCTIPQLPCPIPPEYEKTTWNGYMTITANALDKNPVFYSATVNDPKDPMKRGTCGPGRCGLDILDFLDIVIGPDGSVWASFVDACVATCATGDSMRDAGSDGIAGHLVGGPRLK